MFDRKINSAQRAEIGLMYGQGIKAAEIAERYGISVGYVCRIWFDWRLENKIPKAAPPTRLSSSSVPFLGGPPASFLNKLRCENVAPDPVTEDGVTLAHRNHDQCAWPIGIDTDGVRRFCGKLRYARKSYCGAHYTQSLMKSYEQPPEAAVHYRSNAIGDGKGADQFLNGDVPFLEAA